ncbi:MAG: bifunctional diaminohydroxyphosphoribosylaminopyrimidine deaminase/5-amino-6-(5-phosphoribosylamino)uracil reductase RibD [Myxococcales bacterium]|nr:bifunctional diaminohydroxyphosphoribosylaminopyrimidine deaminase/5-amino-6-(5-phosphoribosylamino)uracil reductase RibD [Myxococcales bacterium]
MLAELEEVLHGGGEVREYEERVREVLAVRVDGDEACMQVAIALATGGTGSTYPNPCVGAVVVEGGWIVGAGHSAATGGPHAEVRALAMAGSRARGATAYVTLEPCAHHGRTPPCTDALIAAGVAEVVYGVPDPAIHRGASDRGAGVLARAGVRVREVGGAAGAACAALHEHYLHHEARRRPFVTLKAATSLDGRIAAAGGDSRWITGEPARRVGHWLRARHHAIAVGADTLLRDDPQLTARLFAGVDPVPVVVDSRLRTAESRATLLRPGTLVVHTEHAGEDRRRSLADRGVQLVAVPADGQGRVDVAELLAALGRRTVRSLLVEGGGRLHASFVAAAAWDRWFWFHAPLLLGDGVPALPGLEFSAVSAAPRLRVEHRGVAGVDMLTVLRR